MSGKWVLPAWTGPDSPQTPVLTDEERDAEAERAYEQHYHPGVTDPAATSGGPDLTAYQVTPIAACPECLADCTSEGRDGWYCTTCQRMWTWQEVAYFEDGDTDRD